MVQLRGALAALLAIVALVGCRTTAIYDVESQPHQAPPSATLQDVDRAIRTAAAATGWEARAVVPGKILATRRSGALMARVSLQFTPRQFSIRYVASERFLESGGRIHRSYNGWVRDLEDRIDRETEQIQ